MFLQLALYMTIDKFFEVCVYKTVIYCNYIESWMHRISRPFIIIYSPTTQDRESQGNLSHLLCTANTDNDT